MTWGIYNVDGQGLVWADDGDLQNCCCMGCGGQTVSTIFLWGFMWWGYYTPGVPQEADDGSMCEADIACSDGTWEVDLYVNGSCVASWTAQAWYGRLPYDLEWSGGIGGCDVS